MRILIVIPCLLFVHFYTIFLWVDVVYGSGQCSDDQKVLLLRLKESITFDTSISVKLSTWDPNVDCCSWEGVGCESGRVVKLDLANETISDGIDNSSSLFDLHHLEEVNLAFNRLNSVDIPSRIGEFVNLTYLNLSNAGFSGQIPLDIAGMTRLINLDISNLYFLGIKPLKLERPNLRTLVGNLSSLKELHLDGVNISTGGEDWCNVISSSLPKLSVLSLNYCNLRGPIDSSLANLQLLSDVHLDNNNLSTEVPSFFANFINLTTLSFSSSGLSGKFPEEIFQVPTLKAIDLSNNELLRGTLPEFPQNSSLERLVISDSNFSGKFPYSIGNLKFLSRIELLRCSFSGFLPSSLSNLTKLVYVDMSSNSFTGPIPSLSYAKSLCQLYLAHNLFYGSINSSIWNALSQLSILDLRNNSFSGTIPSSLLTTPLQKLQLSNNQFTDLSDEFQAVSFSSLSTLDLSGNDLSGPLPLSIFGMRNLRILSLSSNKFSGNFELSVIHRLKHLSSLDLSYNDLSVIVRDTDAFEFSNTGFTTLKLASCHLAKIPDFLRNQSKLSYLDLSVNCIAGDIPNWIWDIEDLHYLNLSYNSLVDINSQHNIPSSLSVLDLHSNSFQGKLVLPPYASYLDYSMNNFSSNIPQTIGDNLTFCYFFSLASNSFSGSIPESFCGATYLEILDLSNNSLSGPVPRCISMLNESLVVLNLGMNHLNGTISDALPQPGCQLETLGLNGNHLSGKVPESLLNCKGLQILNLGNNQIDDTFPCWLKELSNLSVLVLYSNKFNGELGCPETNGSWPMLQIVDLSSNSFSGKLLGDGFFFKAMMVVNESKSISYKFFNGGYYQDTVTLHLKGNEVKLEKILTIFTSIDLSNNYFEGVIPQELGNLRALYCLNLSRNNFMGQIPPSLGNLKQLESLDLSRNKLSGSIPQQLANLNFLQVLNLSFNHLEGHIPRGGQFDNLCEDSFLGNKGLVGPQVKRKCNDNGETVASPATPLHDNNTRPKKSEVRWELIGAEVGFNVGLGIVIGSLIFWQKWRKCYFDQVEKILENSVIRTKGNQTNLEEETKARSCAVDRNG